MEKTLKTMPLFRLLETTAAQRRRRYLSLAISVVVEIIIIVSLVSILRLVPLPMVGPKEREYVLLYWPTSPAENKNPARTRSVARPPIRLRPRPVLVPSIPVLRNVPSPEPAKAVVIPAKTVREIPSNLAVPLPPGPKPVVHTEVFNASGSSAKPTVNAPIKEVQTGGFGDPNGFPGEAQGGSHGNVAKLGSFDLPPGPGYGNGSGGSYGARGVMATGGFGNGIASTAGERGGTGGGGRGGVRSSGFGDARAIPEAPKPQAQTVTPKVQPMEITFKPKPIYSEEARRLGLEGEVVLEAVFSASGELRVLRVVRGLGHGLDEAALRAAEQIRFKPAQRDGQPVDTTATLHILFELAG